MSEGNAEVVRRSYEVVDRTGEVTLEHVHPDFVWNMSTTGNWPEQQAYEGIEQANAFLREWAGAWEDWQTEILSLQERGDKVVAIVRQHGRAKATGLEVDMQFAQVWTFRDGKATRMDMYNDPAQALEAAGFSV